MSEDLPYKPPSEVVMRLLHAARPSSDPSIYQAAARKWLDKASRLGGISDHMLGIHSIGGVGLPHDGCECKNCREARDHSVFAPVAGCACSLCAVYQRAAAAWPSAFASSKPQLMEARLAQSDPAKVEMLPASAAALYDRCAVKLVEAIHRGDAAEQSGEREQALQERLDAALDAYSEATTALLKARGGPVDPPHLPPGVDSKFPPPTVKNPAPDPDPGFRAPLPPGSAEPGKGPFGR